jgi:hypothetical protein
VAEQQKPGGKRRLPVLQSREEPPAADPPPAADERPPARWVAIGAAATFLAWLPLAALAEASTRRLVAVEDGRGVPAPAGVWLVAAHAFAFFAAGVLGGLLVGRAGGAAGRREATLAGAGAGALAWLIAAAQGTPGGAIVWGPLLALIAGLGAIAGYVGGRIGLRLRSRG